MKLTRFERTLESTLEKTRLVGHGDLLGFVGLPHHLHLGPTGHQQDGVAELDF
tara:strand:+ start:379 stop:537 length:159 start_codon:yes stop_codon:yes gene_type:complete